MNFSQSEPRAAAAPAPSRSYGSAMAVISSVFFMWGFVTVLNDILVPHLKAIFALNYTETMLIQFTFFSAYFLMSMPAAKVISWIGFHHSIALGLGVMGLGALMFVPAASIPSYGVFLSGLFVVASGMTLLQVSANPYVAVLGPPAGASSRLNLAQALNSLGTTLGPWVGGFLILSAATGTDETAGMTAAQAQAHKLLEASTVIKPYVGIAILLGLLALAIARFRLPTLAAIEDPSHHTHVEGDTAWRHRPLVLGAVAIFLYVGAEVAIGSFLVSYFMQPNIASLGAQQAAKYVSFYWGGAMIGRFAGSAILRVVRTGTLLGLSALVACALVLTSVATGGHVAMWSIILVGLFNSIMFPSIFTLGIDGLGKLTGQGSGILIAAIVGGAIIPIAEGALADRIGLQIAFLLPAVCYLYIVFYGFVGSRRRAVESHVP
ncbi:MAG: sugar MFS transporter [Bryobacteraceae bacterium]|jgi:FHS family L-fucose permease-like MFS transporter